MTDYAEEQRNELEAIESIYPDSYTGLSVLAHTETVKPYMLTSKANWLLSSVEVLHSVHVVKLSLLSLLVPRWTGTNNVLII